MDIINRCLGSSVGTSFNNSIRTTMYPSASESTSGVSQCQKFNKQDNGRSVENVYSSYLERQKQNASKNPSKSRKAQNTYDVTSYTDKEGRVHKTFSGKGTDVVESMKEAANKKKDEKVKAKRSLNYSYQRVSSQVIMAKNSVSASKAVLAAKRSLADLKRKLKNVDCPDDEKEAALAHARRMLRIAQKKKNNLEMEEMVEITMKSDERDEKQSSASENTGNVTIHDRSADEDQEEDILKKISSASNPDESDEVEESSPRENLEMMIDNMENLDAESADEITDAIDDELEDMLKEMEDEFAEEMSEELNDLMDMMEVVNPHMNKMQYEKLKTKHRCDEQKEMVKADMEYLKEYISSGVSETSLGFSFGA